MKRYVLIAHPCPPAQGTALNTHLASMGVGYWMVGPSTWLLVDAQARPLTFWVNLSHSVAPNARIIVLDADADWMGYGEPPDFAWMRDTWEQPGGY